MLLLDRISTLVKSALRSVSRREAKSLMCAMGEPRGVGGRVQGDPFLSNASLGGDPMGSYRPKARGGLRLGRPKSNHLKGYKNNVPKTGST